jgi:hypothetical protein
MKEELFEMLLLFVLIILMLSGCGSTKPIEFFPEGDAGHYICKEDLERYIETCKQDTVMVYTNECPDDVAGCLVYHQWYKPVTAKPTLEGFLYWLNTGEILHYHQIAVE